MAALPSKSRIDKAGRVLSSDLDEIDEECLELDDVFKDYRQAHLGPLSALTASIQNFLNDFEFNYYIAQRLKRKPQILRKLNRLSVRLTQLQDIGGLRLIVDNDTVVNELSQIIDASLDQSSYFKVHRTTDYRPLGRDDSGYRALHKIIKHDGLFFEIQLRSRAQHHWAESVERTSVFYGKRLKEGEGSPLILQYFKNLSRVFSEIEHGFQQSQESLAILESMRGKSEEIIRRDGHAHLMDSFVNEDVIKTLVQKEKSNPHQINNWILVFDWATANFVTWDIVSRDPKEAGTAYAKYENQFPEHQNFEVVLIGSSDIATVQKTHSHYFGIASPDRLLEDLGQSRKKISEDTQIDISAKQILRVLHKRRVWGAGNGIQKQTLKNHFCKDVQMLDESLNFLVEQGLLVDKGGPGYSLNVAKTADIESFI
ncbi:MAG: RelA/SpoT domain-containing protein [Sphingorhabdus sp.]|uniref:RelA/SpoT domain-containing protein n=1 Tax=Sphingorhabdus sp. TaxID=1902408 RepID=UPI003C955D78